MRRSAGLSSMSAFRIRVLWGLYWLAMFVAMHIPKDKLPTIRVPGLDKEVHFISYGLLAVLCAWSAVRGGAALTARWHVKWFLVFAMYAVADELLQGLAVVNRTPDVADWVTDMVGVIVGFCVVGWLRTRSPSGRR